MDTIRIRVVTVQSVTPTTCYMCGLASQGWCVAYGQELECNLDGQEQRCALCLERSIPQPTTTEKP